MWFFISAMPFPEFQPSPQTVIREYPVMQLNLLIPLNHIQRNLQSILFRLACLGINYVKLSLLKNLQASLFKEIPNVH